jgi:hypothetical protein
VIHRWRHAPKITGEDAVGMQLFHVPGRMLDVTLGPSLACVERVTVAMHLLSEQRSFDQLHEHVDNDNMEFLHTVSPFTLDGGHYCDIYLFR